MSDTPRTDALDHRTCAFGDGYRIEVLTDLCRKLERELAAVRAAVTAERDALREQLAKLIGAAELGLELAEVDLAETKELARGMPEKVWSLEQRYVDKIRAAIDAAKGGAKVSDHIPDVKKMVQLLRQHNAWRRDNDGTSAMTNPTDLSIAIDAVCYAMEGNDCQHAEKYLEAIQQKSSKLAQMELERHELHQKLADVAAERDALMKALQEISKIDPGNSWSIQSGMARQAIGMLAGAAKGGND